MKRTRHIRGKYYLTMPRIVIREPGVYEIRVKVTQVVVTKLKDLKGTVVEGSPLAVGGVVVGEIERGRIDGEERFLVKDEED